MQKLVTPTESFEVGKITPVRTVVFGEESFGLSFEGEAFTALSGLTKDQFRELKNNIEFVLSWSES